MRQVLLIFGIQGSGKGTQGERVKKRYGGFTDIVVGQLLRKKAKTDPKMQEFMKTGKLFPDEKVEGVIEEKINTLSEDKRVLFDGFPRSESQFKIYKRLSEKYIFQTVAINIIVSEEEALTRLGKRHICPKCEYISVGRGKCPRCGQELEKRDDDQNEDAIRQRIKIFKKETQPIIDHFKDESELIEIDGIGTFDEVSQRIFEALDKYYLK